MAILMERLNAKVHRSFRNGTCGQRERANTIWRNLLSLSGEKSTSPLLRD